MRTEFDHIIARVEQWIESIQREKDRLSVLMRRFNDGAADVSPLEFAFAIARMEQLDKDLQQARDRLAALESQRHWPEVMFKTRPLLKVPLRRRRKSA